MSTLKKCFSTVAFSALLLGGTLSAQEPDFDLSAQRSEIQTVAPVPGCRLDHGGIVINPTPQQMEIDSTQRLDISRGLCLKDPAGCFAEDVDFVKLADKGPRLEILFGAKRAARQGVKPVSGAYRLTVDARGVTITGYDECGAFYGLQTLRQLIASPASAGGRIPHVTVNDYPDLPSRGVVEGFYGTPWSHEVRMSLIDFYGRFKLNTYIYGPKDDPYHSCPN